MGRILKCKVMRENMKVCKRIKHVPFPCENAKTYPDILYKVVEDSKALRVLAILYINQRSNLGRLFSIVSIIHEWNNCERTSNAI